jgi:molybdopterin molybdotransferase
MTATTKSFIPAPRGDSKRLSVADARARILADVAVVREIENVPVRTALGRVLARDIVSPIDVPAHTNSAVDGYALARDELPKEGSREFRVVGSALAGRTYTGTVARGDCVQIMTGAPMPTGTDAVVIREQAAVRGDRVTIEYEADRARNVRMAGEDIAKGQAALAAGKEIAAAELGMLASLGLAEVPAYRRARVAYFSTGDELRPVGEALKPGQIYESNRYTLFGLLTRAGVELRDLGVVADRPDSVRAALADAAANTDAVITTGGVSVGDADYVKETVEALGTIRFWQVAMRPGRPFVFGKLGNAAFFGLPGNPVAVMVTFYQLVRPALRCIMGEPSPPLLPTFRARSLSPLRTRVGRTEFIRGVLGRDENGELTVRSTGSQGSGILSSMSVGDCFIVLPPESGDTEPGAMVDVQPFHGLM